MSGDSQDGQCGTPAFESMKGVEAGAPPKEMVCEPAADMSALAFASSIVDTVREPLLVLDSTLHVRRASRSFYNTFGVSREQTEARFVYDLGNGQWNIPALRTLLE